MSSSVMSNNEAVEKANVLVFASERVGLKALPGIENRNFNVHFEPFQTGRRFDEYDGVVVFQRTFEELKYIRGDWNSHLSHACHVDDLDRRTKESYALVENGGFLCFVLHAPLVDRDKSTSFRDTDLVKRVLRGPSFYRHDLVSRTVDVEATISEFERFIKLLVALIPSSSIRRRQGKN